MNSLLRISQRNHLGLILMAELACSSNVSDFRSLQDIAEMMELSLGYLEEVAMTLKQAGLIEGRKGPGGGYRLMKPPKDISVEAIVVALEGPVVMVDCQVEGKVCPVAKKCSTKSLWNFMQKSLSKTLKETTLEDVVARTV